MYYFDVMMWSLKHERYKSEGSGILGCDTMLIGTYLPTSWNSLLPA